MNVKGSLTAIRSAFEDTADNNGAEDIKLIVEAILLFLGGFAMTAAKVLDSGSPFGIAAVAAAGVGLNGVCCLFGAGIGYIVMNGFSGGIRYLAAIVILFTLRYSFQDTALSKSVLFAPVSAAVVTLATGILATSSIILTGSYSLVCLLLETVLSFGASLFFAEALYKGEDLSEAAELRHMTAVMITFSVFLMAMSRICVMDVLSVGRLAALILLLLCTVQGGVLTGCAVGTVLGTAMDLSAGGVPFFTAAYAFSGLLSGLFSRHGRAVFVLSFILADASVAACVWSVSPQLPALVEVFCASVIFILIPNEIINRLGAAIKPTQTGSGEAGLRRYVSQRVRGLGAAYKSLYDVVYRNTEIMQNDTDPAKVFDRAADTVCKRCKDKNRCWNAEYIDTLSALNDAGAAIQKRGTLRIEDIPGHFRSKCRMPEAFVTAVNGELRAAAYRRHFAAQLRESRDTAWGQYSDLSDVLSDVASELSGANGADHLSERRLVRYLRTLDIEADCAVFRDGRGRLRAVIESGSLMRLYDEPDYLDKLSYVLGMRLCKSKTAKESQGKLTLIEAEPLSVSVGIAAMKKEGERVSGDRGTYFKTDSGVLCVILSDGMGCGDDAAKESKEVIEILEKFLRAGLDPSVAMKTLNSVMLLKNGDNWGFATVDLMCVDLFSGETCFYKFGAAPSYVLTGRTIRRIKGESFAPGLSAPGTAPDVVRMRLKPGNTAIIASDGVVADSNDGWLREILDSSTEDMKLLARTTLKEAEKQYGNCDDMTVLAVKVQQRE